MKKLLLSIIFLCSVATLSAQYKGDIYECRQGASYKCLIYGYFIDSLARLWC